MNTQDTLKMTFKTKFGLFEWMVISFGLTHVFATFMNSINDIFRAYMGKFLAIYLDDILIFSSS
jgi:hypothetical protein